MELSAVLEPERPAKTDKPAIIDDAIRVISNLKNEAQELKDTNEKLLEEIKCLKVSLIGSVLSVFAFSYLPSSLILYFPFL